MRKHTSLYLDALRVFAALAVFFSHLTRDSLSAGNRIVAFLGQFGQEGVAIFFVISGIVIAYVSSEKEHDFRSYLVARLGRLWSVMIPALVLTVVLDTVGRVISPGMYAEPAIAPWGFDLASLWNFFAPMFFLNKVSFAAADPGTNGPFWSLCFEFWYYILFGIAFYLRGIRRVLLVIVAMLIAGPVILSLFPIWGFGLVVFVKLQRATSSRLNVAVWAASCLALLVLMTFKYKLGVLLVAALPGLNLSSASVAEGIAHFAVGLACAANILIYDACGGVSVFRAPTIERLIRFLAARSFSLYLYQAPCLFFFGALTHGMDSVVWRLLLIVILSMSTILLLAELTEGKKKWFVKLVEHLIPGSSVGRPVRTVAKSS